MNILEARRRVIGGEVYKKIAEGNPVSVRSLARMRPGLKLFGRSTQNKTTGAQLFDVSAGGAGWIDTETGEFLSSQDNYVSDFIKVGPENQYYINNDAILRYIYSYNIDKGFLRKESYGFAFTTGRDVEYIRFAISGNAAGALKRANTIMLNAGSSALPWEPYTGGHPSPSPDYPQEIMSVGDNGSIDVSVSDGAGQNQFLTVQTPNGLPGIPVNSGGNYTDSDGQQWICDEIDFKRGKYVQRVAWVTFDGSEDELWLFDSNGDPVNLSARGRVLMYGMCSQKKRNHVLCNRRIYSKNTYYDTENACFSDRANIYIYGEKATVETESEWRQDLSEKPVTVLYEMETPIETDLSEEQLSAYSNLHTNRPTTVVSATDGAGLEITYKTKKSLEVT